MATRTGQRPRNDAHLWATMIDVVRVAGVDDPERVARQLVAVVRREENSDRRTWAPGDQLPDPPPRVSDLDGAVWEHQSAGRGMYRMAARDRARYAEGSGDYEGVQLWPFLLDAEGAADRGPQSRWRRVMGDQEIDQDIPLHGIELWVCELCLTAAGGECHVPGCAFWWQPAPVGSDLARLRGLRELTPTDDQRTAEVVRLQAQLALHRGRVATLRAERDLHRDRAGGPAGYVLAGTHGDRVELWSDTVHPSAGDAAQEHQHAGQRAAGYHVHVLTPLAAPAARADPSGPGGPP